MSGNLRRDSKASASGQALLEFALLLPLLFLLIVNVVNFGGFIYAWIAVSNAARTGAQYLCIGGAMVGMPASPSSAAVQTLVLNDLHTLPNSSSSLVRVCKRTGSVTCIGPGTYTPPAETAEPAPGGATVTYAIGSVDATYTYKPFIPMFNFSKLGVNATHFPGAQPDGSIAIHRQAAMRLLQ